MQPFNENNGDHVQLLVQSSGSGSHPFVSYTVDVCGTGPYSGDLLIGGDAKLAESGPPGAETAGSIPQATIQHISSLTIMGVSTSGAPLFYQSPNLGPVEIAQVTADSPVPCGLSTLTPALQTYVSGLASAPIEQSWNAPFALWHGPNSSQAWPLTGTIPLVVAGVRYFFGPGRDVPQGQWKLPSEHVQVSHLGTGSSWLVDAAQPAPTSASPVSWSSDSPIQPTARLTDASSMSSLQDWAVGAGVLMGIGGSMIATLAYQRLNQRRATGADDTTDPPAAGPVRTAKRGPGPAPTGPAAWKVALSAIVVIGLARQWRGRRRT